MKCFVYGTLRPGDYNHTRVGGTTESKPATTAGQIYCVFSNGGYPCAKFERRGTIYGDVVRFKPERWEDIAEMEEGAGYELCEIEVTYADGSTEKVPSWQYIREPSGLLIPGGDWFKR